MIKQVQKFYLASFLKNQTYFVPIMIVFFQDLGLSYSEIFWIYTIGSGFSFLIEIPTGLIADIFGKRKSVIVSRFFIFLSFMVFGFASGFWSLVLANVLYEFGKSFRSGTETAYVFDCLKQNKDAPGYTYVKANQKFYARLSEAIATAIGGFLAVNFGFNFVFFIASVPALVNFLQTLTWRKIKENEEKYQFKQSAIFAWNSLKSVFQNKILSKIVFNILIFSSTLFAADKFIQPYMQAVGIEIAYFGLIYSVSLLLIAFFIKYISKLEEKFSGEKVMNYITVIAIIPLLILATGYQGVLGVALFFALLVAENVRSPIANTVFHGNIDSKNRATMGSILELMRTSGKLIVLPLAGYFTDTYSMNITLMIFAGLVILNTLFFRAKKVK